MYAYMHIEIDSKLGRERTTEFYKGLCLLWHSRLYYSFSLFRMRDVSETLLPHFLTPLFFFFYLFKSFFEAKAGGDKTKKRLSKAMSSIVYESSEAVPKSPKSSLKSARRVCGETSKKNSVSSKTRKDAGVPRGYVPKPDRLSSLLPAGTLKKKERPRVSPRRVVAEGHYHQESNVISVVVKPVNIKMDREQLNLKVIFNSVLFPFFFHNVYH